MQSNDFDWHDGKVVYWGLDRILVDAAVELQQEELTEDLAQVEFRSDTILDVGWHPEFSVEDRFVVSVVQHRDWDSPVFRVECRNVSHLCVGIRAAVCVASGNLRP